MSAVVVPGVVVGRLVSASMLSLPGPSVVGALVGAVVPWVVPWVALPAVVPDSLALALSLALPAVSSPQAARPRHRLTPRAQRTKP